jgi:AcrR family transcriptional regulator
MTQPRAADETETIDRIFAAAYRCFDRVGIAKTAIEDIARESGTSRPTIYRYFKGKSAILRHICGLEIRKVNDELRRRVTRTDTFADLMTESLLLTTRIADKNRYVRMMIESPDIASRSADPNSIEYEEVRAVWHGLLAQGLRTGNLDRALSEDEIASWLVLSETMLLIKVGATEFTDAQLRAFIRRFILRPILPPDHPPHESV